MRCTQTGTFPLSLRGSETIEAIPSYYITIICNDMFYNLSYKSSHSELIPIINSTFLVLETAFICFSFNMAFSGITTASPRNDRFNYFYFFINLLNDISVFFILSSEFCLQTSIFLTRYDSRDTRYDFFLNSGFFLPKYTLRYSFFTICYTNYTVHYSLY
ncbi:hypothetical protein ES705_49856 [subsurface metagenome]